MAVPVAVGPFALPRLHQHSRHDRVFQGLQASAVVFEGKSALTTIGNRAFRGSKLTNITIPNTVTSMGVVDYPNNQMPQGVFESCTSLETVTLPSNLEALAYTTFRYCTALKDIVFADDSKLSTIYAYAFDNCSSLTQISLPSSLANLCGSAFQNSSFLAMDLPAYLLTGQSYLFSDSYGDQISNSIERIRIITSETSKEVNLGSTTFASCKKLSAITIDGDVEKLIIGGQDWCKNDEALTALIFTGDTSKLDVEVAEGAMNNAGNITVYGTASATDESNRLVAWAKAQNVKYEQLNASYQQISASLEADTFDYIDAPLTPAVTVKLGDEVLGEESYSVTYVNNDKKGTATVLVTGKGDYSAWSQELTFQVTTNLADIQAELADVPATVTAGNKDEVQAVLDKYEALSEEAKSNLTAAELKTIANAQSQVAKLDKQEAANVLEKVQKQLDEALAKLAAGGNAMQVSVKTASVKKAKVAKKAQTVKAITVSNAKGAVTYAKAGGSKKLTVNKATGKVKVKKGTKKGTYKIKVKVTAADGATKTVQVKVKVK